MQIVLSWICLVRLLPVFPLEKHHTCTHCVSQVHCYTLHVIVAYLWLVNWGKRKAAKHFSQQHFERPLGWSHYELDSGGDPLFITYPRYVSAHLSFLLYVTFWKWVKIKLNSVSRLWLLIYLSPFSKSKDGFSRERRFIVTEQILF